MATSGFEGKADKTIALQPQVKSRLVAHRLTPDEALWRVVERLLDSYDLSHPKNAPQPAPEVQS